MNISAQANYIRTSPRKTELVCGLIRGRTVPEAQVQLQESAKVTATPIQKLLASAVANAHNSLEIKDDDLVVKEISVHQGPTLQRYKPRAFGRAGKIRKRMSHVKIVLGIREGANVDLEKVMKKAATPEKPTNLEDVEKELEKASKDATKKDSGSKQDSDKPEKKDNEPPHGHGHGDADRGSKGSGQKFGKKLFSRKVG